MAEAFSSERSTKDVINDILDDYEKLTKELFESLSAVSLYRTTKQDASSGDTAKAVDQLIAKDKELQVAIKQVQEQQARQQEIQTVKEEILKKDQEILSLESQLKEAEKLLSQALFQAKKKLSAINQADKGMVSSEDLIKYAHRISSSNAVEAPVSWMPGDPRRPYPQDIEMRSGLLGRLMEGVPSETDQPVTGDSTLQELMQPSVSASHVSQPVSGLGLTNGQASSFSWQSHLSTGQSSSLQHDTSSSLDIIANNLTKEVTNGRQEQGVDEVEFMSSSSSSSSSDSP
ncbi:mediator of RNA polymerase II transcription subunit 4-like [Orbicella faveolata]|uniref:mediator of RNA polymerase II transcription subunit 4-like n=1 Tax=Orbicella faveolata TaxID=48498 RepID=UPI0009E2C93B|nr:mediator of RNA polymerase II transcription subunit 4-like [Orbicella faveolata]